MCTRNLVTLFLFLGFSIHAEGLEELNSLPIVGCDTSVEDNRSECSQEDILLELGDESILGDLGEDLEEESIKEMPKATVMGKVKITRDLESVSFIYQKKRFLIERTDSVEERSCPPHCISPMNIANIKTVGELETLQFIASFKRQKNRILVDARTTQWHKKSTIPGAVNIPYSMLSQDSEYQDEVLQLLGAKKLQKKWYFKDIHQLLIFDNGPLDTQATKIIEKLIEIGYPQDKILYYRGGVESWRGFGLTLL